jgi:probable HAF family extracellular repeat protein
MADLGTLGGGSSLGGAINNLGQVTGRSDLSAPSIQYHAFLYTGTPGSGGAMADLGTLGGNFSTGRGINDSGQVVGDSSTTDSPYHAFLYTGIPGNGGAMHDLGTLPGDASSSANAINAAGLVVGNSGVSGVFLYVGTPGTDGHMIDLNAWLDANNPIEGAKWTLGTAFGITDSGLITGTGDYNDGPGGLSDGGRAFLLDASSLTHPFPADFNGDGVVNFADLLVLAQHYGTKNGATLQTGDANGDGAVNFSDLLLLSQEYQQAAGPAAVSTAPEPACAAILLILILLRRPMANGRFGTSHRLC